MKITTYALAAVIARMWLTFVEYLQMLRATQQEAVTDPLTGLGNRLALITELAAAATGDEPRILLLFDLNGFKTYNDRFGHPTGDSVLRDTASPLK